MKVLAWAVCGVVGLGVAGVGLAQEAGKPAGGAATAKVKEEKKGRTAESALRPEPHVPERHEEFMKRKEAGPIGLLFIGDSITDFWPKWAPEVWKRFEKYDPADFGVSGDRTEHVLWRIEHGELDGLKPKATVVMIGTNNVGHFPDEKPEWAAAGVKEIVKRVREKMPETKVLLLGVFPRDGAGSEMRKRVTAINKEIATLGDVPGVTYLDISERFLDEKGEIPKDVMPDGLHPNAKGYEVWYEAMWPVLSEMVK